MFSFAELVQIKYNNAKPQQFSLAQHSLHSNKIFINWKKHRVKAEQADENRRNVMNSGLEQQFFKY